MPDVLRMKYKLYEGRVPNDAIIAAVPTIDEKTDLFLGRYTDGDWKYGEIVTALSNKSALESALSDFSVSFFADDNAAKSYVDGVLPTDTVLQPKITVGAAEINETTGLLEKPEVES